MQSIGKILAGICAILFVITSALSLTLFSMDQKAFSAATYKRAFQSQNIYERMPGVIANVAMQNMSQNPNAPAYTKNLSEKDWELIITTLLPPEEIKSVSDDALDSVFNYLNGKTDSATFSLLPLKRRFAGDAGVQAVLQVLRAQPDCTAEQIANLTVAALTGGAMELCNPPQEAIGLITPLIESQIAFATLAIPDEVNLISTANSENDPRVALNRIRFVMRLSLLLPLGLLLLITILAVRSLKDWLAWWGYSFLASGILSLLTSAIGIVIGANQFQRILQRGSNSVPSSFIDIGREIGGAVARQIMSPVALVGVVITVIGLIMVVVLFLIARRVKDQIAAR